MPRWQRIRAHHFVIGGLLLAVVVAFCALLFRSLDHANDKLLPRLLEMEKRGPP